MNLTKVLPPRPVYILERERLTGKLRSWEKKKLVIVHAQAGQGKSTLVADYIRSLPSPPVWYNMDQGDDDPAVFLSCLGQAVQHCYPGHVPKLPPLPQERYGMIGVRQGVSGWMSHVFSNLPRPALVIFDDYNNLTTPANLSYFLKTLIEATPPHVRFIFISRIMPELEIARLRAKGEVGEITGEDLKFNDREVYTLFTGVFGMDLGQDVAALINSTAEGWPAGIVLMHEYLATHAPQKSSTFTGRGPLGFQTHVFDYLAQEVFSHLPADMQNFLMRTSIVDYLPTELMSRLTGLPAAAPNAPGTAQMVEQLLKRNLFLTALNDDATIVRYHALFREFLHKKLLSHARPAEVRKLYAVAAQYFKNSDDPVRTVNLYLSSGQVDKAAEQIEACGQRLITQGQTHTLLRWIESLPKEYESRPWLMFYKAVAYRFTNPRKALRHFDSALVEFRSSRSAGRRVAGQMLSLVGIIEACFFTSGNFKRMERAASIANAILKRHKKESGDARSRLLLAIGTAYFFIGKLKQGSDALINALDSFTKSRDYFYQIHSAIYLAPCSLYRGDFLRAREAVQRGFEALKSIPDEKGGEAAVYMAQAMTALFEGDFTEAQQCIDKCSSLASEHDLEAIDFLSLDIGGWIKTAVGDYRGAELLLSECKRKGEIAKNAFFNSSAAHLLSINHLHQGRFGRAKTECDYALSIRKRLGSRLFYAVSLSASGAINLKLGNLARAERELRAALKMFQQIEAAQQRANVFLLLAQLEFRRKKDQDAKQYLHEGFRIGQEIGFTYYYLLNAEDMIQLAGKALSYGICSEYCGHILKNASSGRAASKLKLYCFGGFKAYKDDVLIPDWKSRLAKNLLKLLAAHDGQKLQRDVIADALWAGDQTEETRKTKLNSMFYRLRKTIEREDETKKYGSFIIQEGNLVYLDKNRVWSDLGQFLMHLETAGRLKTGSDPNKVIQEYENAIALYRGDFLSEDIYEDWITVIRERLRGLYLKAMEDAACLSESMGDKERASKFYEKLFLADSCNEKACRWLMEWRMSFGDRGEAIRMYERCQRALSAELDAEPDGQTQRLYKGIIG